MAPKPLPPDQIKPFPTWIGIEEFRGSARPRPTTKPGETAPAGRGARFGRWLRRKIQG